MPYSDPAKKREANRRWYLANKDRPRPIVSHGVSGYQRGCRCDSCRSAWRDYHRVWMHAHPEQRRKHADRSNERYHASKASNQDSEPEAS